MRVGNSAISGVIADAQRRVLTRSWHNLALCSRTLTKLDTDKGKNAKMQFTDGKLGGLNSFMHDLWSVAFDALQ